MIIITIYCVEIHFSIWKNHFRVLVFIQNFVLFVVELFRNHLICDLMGFTKIYNIYNWRLTLWRLLERAFLFFKNISLYVVWQRASKAWNWFRIIDYFFHFKNMIIADQLLSVRVFFLWLPKSDDLLLW